MFTFQETVLVTDARIHGAFGVLVVESVLPGI